MYKYANNIRGGLRYILRRIVTVVSFVEPGMNKCLLDTCISVFESLTRKGKSQRSKCSSGFSGPSGETRLHLRDAQIKDRLGQALASGAHPCRI